MSTSYDNFVFNEALKEESFLLITKQNAIESYSDIDDSFHVLRKEKKAEKQITTNIDYIITSSNTMDVSVRSIDSLKPVRFKQDLTIQCIGPHPYDVSHRMDNNFKSVRRIIAYKEMYANLVDRCNRHQHTSNYCQLNGKCRFLFPRLISETMRVVVLETSYKTGLSINSYRKNQISILARTNDGWLNNHSPIAMRSFCANQDMSLLISEDECINYVAKYSSKAEKIS